MTPNAVAAIRKVLDEAEGALGLRIAVHGGCGGPQYEMGLEGQAREGDAVLHIDNLLLFVDQQSKPWLEGVQVDFCDTPAATGFVFNTPGLCGSCSRQGNCGS